jgi:hypothetical protein
LALHLKNKVKTHELFPKFEGLKGASVYYFIMTEEQLWKFDLADCQYKNQRSPYWG